MRTMTCKQLGGACDLKFRAETFEEIVEKSKKHGMEMYQKGDPAHLEAMNKARALSKTPNAMIDWIESKKKEFLASPEH